MFFLPRKTKNPKSMDFSSLSESQQQLHQQFQEYQQQAQRQPYDPSQSQSYDQSYYPYQQYQQHQYHPYYQTDYTTTYQQPTQNDSTPILPPGVSAAPDPPPQPVISFAPPQQQQQQHHSYYPVPAAAEQQLNSSSSYPVPSGLNAAAAAAVAALSQLTQFAGSMDAAERARAGLHDRQWQGGPMHVGPHGGYQPGPFAGHRGGKRGGRGGGGPLRGGGGRGNFGHRPPRLDSSTSQSQGRGRGRGNKRGFPHHAASQPETLLTSVVFNGNVEVSAGMQGEAPVSASVPQSVIAPGQAAQPGKPSSTKKQPPNAWCELCRVACTGLDILEKHKSGKKHKKNLQRYEELQKAGNSMHMPMSLTVNDSQPAHVLHTDSNPTPASDPELVAASASTISSVPTVASSLLSELTTTPMDVMQSQQQSLLESKSEVLALAEGGETSKAKNSPENMSTEVIIDEKKLEPEQQIDKEGHAKVQDGEPTEAQGKKRKVDNFDTPKRGSNRKMRGGRGGKKMRTSDRPTRPMEPRKPKEVLPITCDLCNVKCDTPAVFETHLAGKKHISKLKRFQGHQAMFGPLGLQALYPPNPNTQPIFIPQGHQQTMFPPQGSFHQPVAYLPPPQQAAILSQPQVQLNLESHVVHGTWDGLNNDKPLEFQGLQGAVVRQEGQLTLGNILENNVARSEEKPVDAVIGSEQTAPTSSENIIFP